MGNIGSCPMCQRKGIELTEHHVIESSIINGKIPSIDLCKESHVSLSGDSAGSGN